MTIQISVLLWTIICFVALSFILNKLLFKPFFKVMDARRERLETAVNVKTQREEEAARLAQEAQAAAEETAAAAEKQRLEALSQLREEVRAAEIKAEKDQLDQLAEYSETLASERQEMLRALVSHTGELTDMVSAKLLDKEAAL